MTTEATAQPDLAAAARRVLELAGRDSALARVPDAVRAPAERALRAAPDADALLLAAMRLMALAGNGHSRALPNEGARVVPLRLVWLADGPCVAEGPLTGARLAAVNGIPAAEAARSLRPWLAGTDQRARGLAPFALAWPAAVAAATGRAGPPVLDLETAEGPQRLAFADADLVPGDRLYPLRETGIAARLVAPLAPGGAADGLPWLAALPGGARLLRIGDLSSAPAPEIAERLQALEPEAGEAAGLVVDLRGNPGGNFFGAADFALAMGRRAARPRLAVLVDKHTFSAALVAAALLKHHAGGVLIGEEMGDAARFDAEGALDEVPGLGLRIRHSDGWHDWETGRPDAARTPPAIAARMVAAGDLRPAIAAAPAGADLAAGRDVALAAALACLSAGPS